MFLGTSCYRYFNAKKTWLDARAQCHKFKADLVNFTSGKPFNFPYIHNVTNSYFKSEKAFSSLRVIANSTLFDKDISVLTSFRTVHLSLNVTKMFCLRLIKP
ncbi:unnamed protein product [Rotaria socialis]